VEEEDELRGVERERRGREIFGFKFEVLEMCLIEFEFCDVQEIA
jgi:hypothetical protein